MSQKTQFKLDLTIRAVINSQSKKFRDKVGFRVGLFSVSSRIQVLSVSQLCLTLCHFVSQDNCK